MVPVLYISRTSDGEGLPLPSYESKNHMALTLQAAMSAPIRLKPGERAYVPVGFAIGIPKGFCGQIVSIPTLARRSGIVVSDAPSLLHPADSRNYFDLVHRDRHGIRTVSCRVFHNNNRKGTLFPRRSRRDQQIRPIHIYNSVLQETL